MSDSHSLPQVIRDALLAFQQQRWIRRSLRTLVLLGSGGLLAVLLMIAGDALLHWPETLRQLLAVVFWAVVLFSLLRSILLPLLWQQNPIRTARAYEQQFPDRAHNNISSAVAFALNRPPGVSDWMMQRCIAIATQTIAATPRRQHATDRSMQRLRVLCGLILAAWFMCLAPADNRAFILRSTVPWMNVPRPTDIQFIVEPGNGQVARGTDIIFQVKTIPSVDKLHCHIRWDYGHQEILECRHDSDQRRWHLELGPALEHFSYTFHSGDAESQRYRLDIGAAAQISEAALSVRAPDYIDQPSQQISGHDVDALKGSRIQFFARLSNFNLHHASLQGEDEWQLPLDVRPDGDAFIVQGHWFADTTRHVSLHLWNQQGLHHQHPQQWFIRVTDDKPPDITLKTDLPDSLLSSAAQDMQVQLHCKDDVSIDSIDIQFGNQHRMLDQRALHINDGERNIKRQIALALSQWHHNIGDRLWLRAVCRDSAGQKQESTRIQWLVCSEQDARRARQAHQLGLLTETLANIHFKSSLLATRWSDIRSNIRPDDMQAQSGDLLQADQQMSTIQKELQQFMQQTQTLQQRSLDDYQQELHALNGLARYSYNLHAVQFLNRGAHMLHTQPARMQSILEDSVTDSELLNDALSNLLQLCRTVHCHYAIDALELRYQLNSQHIGDSNRRILGQRLWQQPVYATHLLCQQYPNAKLDGKAKRSGKLPVTIDNTNLPEIGSEQFSLHWRGDIYITTDGEWEFHIISDDGIQMSIDDNKLVSSDAWRNQAAASFSSSLKLKQGWHSIDIRYFQDGGESTLHIKAGVKGEAKKDINTFDMRSPRSRQTSADLIADMLRVRPSLMLSWQDLADARQDIVDVALHMHEWAIDLSMPQLHRVAHSCTSTAQPYTSEEAEHLSAALRNSLQWKPVSLQRQFKEARQLLQGRIEKLLLPLKRQIIFDDLLLHVFIMEEKSRLLKDWGLPYEYVAQTHKFLRRMKEQALTLHAHACAELRRLCNDTRRSTGERQQYWQLLNQLNGKPLEDINSLNIDNHDIIWQLPALRTQLIKLYRDGQHWRETQPLTLFTALALSERWLAKHEQQAAAWYLHRDYQSFWRQRFQSQHAQTDQQGVERWLKLGNSKPDSIQANLAAFLKDKKRRATIDRQQLRLFWQLALIESEFHFEQGRRLEALSALYLALALEHLSGDGKDTATVSDCQRLLKTAESISKSADTAYEELSELIPELDKQTLEGSLQLLAAQALSERHSMDFLSLISRLPAISEPQCAWQSWDSWVKSIDALPPPAHNTIALQDRLSESDSDIQQRTDTVLQSLNPEQENVPQRLRWQTLHKDLKTLFSDEQKQFSNAFERLLHLEARLAVFCQEQAQYTRNRFAAFTSESDASRQRIFALLHVQQACHQQNSDHINHLRTLFAREATRLKTWMAYPWLDTQASGDQQQLLQQVLKLHQESEQFRQRLASLAAGFTYNYDSKQIRRWQQHCQKAVAGIQKIMSDQQLLLEPVIDIEGQNQLALLSLLADIDHSNIQTINLIHQQSFHSYADLQSWRSLGGMMSSMLLRMRQRQPLIDACLEPLQKLRHDSDLHEPAAVDIWIDQKFARVQQRFHTLLTDYKRKHLQAPRAFDEDLMDAAASLVNHSFAHALRTMQQEGDHADTPFHTGNNATNNNTVKTIDNYQRRYEQQWQQSKTLIRLRAQYEYYDLFTNEQKSLIYNYFESVTESEP